MYKRILIILLLSFTFFIQKGTAQFYNGLQMSFGKNRVQYHEPFWRYFRYQDFDVYYDKAGRDLAEYVSKNAVFIQQEVANQLQIYYSRRIIFVVFNTLNDLKQSNIGLSTSEEHYNIGGTTQIIDNKIVLYFNGDHNDLKRQIRSGIAMLMLREFLYGTENYREIISNSALQVYPEWFVAGLSEYISGNWNSIIEEQLVQGLKSKKYLKLVHLEGENAVLVGNALWKYISETYGNEAVTNILFLSKVTEDIDGAFVYVLDKSLKTLLKEMSSYYIERHSIVNSQKIEGKKVTLSLKSKRLLITNIALSPDNTSLLYVTNNSGKTKILYKAIDKKRTKKIYKTGYKLQQITDKSYPIIAWHPSGKVFSYFYEDKGTIWYTIYDIETKVKIVREFHHFEKILEFDYSTDGNYIVFSGVKSGQTDIYTYNPQTYNYTQYTNDLADDRCPTSIKDDAAILFSSNRNSTIQSNLKDSLVGTYDLFIVNKNLHDKNIQRVQNTISDNEFKAYEYQNQKYLYMSDKNGIRNLYATISDSTISFIDTTVHYRFYTEIKPLTNFSQSILDYSFSKNSEDLLLYYSKKNKNHISYISLNDLMYPKQNQIQTTYYKSKQDSTLLQNAIVSQLYKSGSQKYISSETIDFNSYIFEYERNPYNYLVDSIFLSDSTYRQIKVPNLYETNFYINQIVNQIDFGFLNSGYQTFTGDAYYFMPGLNFFLKFGVIDLFEDYRITGGVRFTGNFNTNEYLFSIENLKKRWDKQLIFHKQSLMTYSIEGKSGFSIFYHKLQDYNLKFYAKYPLNQVSGFIISPNIRVNQDIVVSTDINSLREPSNTEVWSGVSFKYIFDNTIPKSLNIMYGTRLKVFAEAFTKVTDTDSYLTVFGLDARNYQKIHRNIIIATRAAYSFSYGKSPLLYYLGSVDNWVNIMQKYETFNTSIEYDKNVDWAYQAVATNLRGFSQNIRNGPSFGVINAEIRIPLIQYIVNRPIASDILTNFQIVGFLDAGAAWAGIYPGAKENAYNYLIVENQPIKVVVDEMRTPYVYGYGYGIRTRIFGYFLRADWAWGVDEGITDKIFYLSMSLDF